MRVFFDEDKVRSVEVSLPRIMRGHNGTLIKSQLETDEAWQGLLALLCEVSTGDKFEAVFQRVDLCFHFKGDIRDFFLAYQNFVYPRIKKLPTRWYETHGLSWKGRHLCCRIYDKVREQTRKLGNIVRVEFQLEGKRLGEEYFGNQARLTYLDFDESVKVFRRLLHQFTPKEIPRVSKLAELFAVAEIEGWRGGDASALDLHLRESNARYARIFRREVARTVLSKLNIDFRTLMPEGKPLVFIDAEPLRQPQRVGTACLKM